MKLTDLVFSDCMIVGFSRDAAQQKLTLTFEAHDANGAASEPDLYTLECSGLKDVRLKFSPEFLEDLNRPYDSEGVDQRANEIHALHRDASGYVHIVADMMEGSFYCHGCLLHSVVEVEVGV
jgi:hypothetical protein